jgi:hypothetical protein
MKKFQALVVVFFIAIGVVIVGSCSKSDTPAPNPTPTPNTDACANSVIKIGLSSNPSNACTPNGTIAVATTGSTAGTTFQYQFDNSAFSSNTDYTSVGAGDHTITVKNNLGCIKTEKITVVAKPSGSQFLAVKSLLGTSCAPCHTTRSDGAFNISNQCDIIAKSSSIVKTAVTNGTMPKNNPLTVAQKKIITDWITGGGKDTN